MKLLLQLALACALLSFHLSCGKGKVALVTEEAPVEAQPLALADNPNAVLSDTLQRLRGRWVQEVEDPRLPNPPMMRLFATADNTLTGRMLFAGAFLDTGVAATLHEEAGVFTMTLTDDDLRPHEHFPKERVLTGALNAATHTLELKARDGGENMKFEFDAVLYSLKFNGNVYHCIIIPVTGPSGGSGSTGSSGASGGSGHLSLSAEPAPPTAALRSCGISAYYNETWSRMSGSGG